MKSYLVNDLSRRVYEFTNYDDAQQHFDKFLNSCELIGTDKGGNQRTLKQRTHTEVGEIEINNKCVYVKVPFYKASDKPEIVISKIGETPEKLRSKMDVIDEKWNINN
jgi:hypothetical protein